MGRKKIRKMGGTKKERRGEGRTRRRVEGKKRGGKEGREGRKKINSDNNRCYKESDKLRTDGKGLVSGWVQSF